MKHPIRLLIPAAGLAIGMTFSSCIVPTDGYGGSSTTVTTYQPGRRINSLPGGYRTETISGTPYYYHDGSYYRSDSGGYVVVEAPRSSRYYSDYDRHHVQHRDRTGDRQPRGPRNESVRTVTRLPDGYRVVTRGGNQYYQAGDQYYRREGGAYVVVSQPY
jgi:hypothetical protein